MAWRGRHAALSGVQGSLEFSSSLHCGIRDFSILRFDLLVRLLGGLNTRKILMLLPKEGITLFWKLMIWKKELTVKSAGPGKAKPTKQ